MGVFDDNVYVDENGKVRNTDWTEISRAVSFKEQFDKNIMQKATSYCSQQARKTIAALYIHAPKNYIVVASQLCKECNGTMLVVNIEPYGAGAVIKCRLCGCVRYQYEKDSIMQKNAIQMKMNELQAAYKLSDNESIGDFLHTLNDVDQYVYHAHHTRQQVLNGGFDQWFVNGYHVLMKGIKVFHTSNETLKKFNKLVDKALEIDLEYEESDHDPIYEDQHYIQIRADKLNDLQGEFEKLDEVEFYKGLCMILEEEVLRNA